MTSPHASPLDALKGGFRKACVKRLVGDEPGAVEVLRDEIPRLVVAWAKSTSLDASEKKAKLKELFDDESSRAEELAVAFDLFSGRFEARVASIVRKELGEVAGRLEALARRLDEAPHPGGADRHEPAPVEEEVQSQAEVSEDSEDFEELDPPKGIGLRFDEIEQMIDEVLQMDDS